MSAMAAALISSCVHQQPAVETAAIPPPAPPKPTPALLTFEATAYSVSGKTASGAHTRRGVVAADPAVLPIGSRIRVHGANQYSGEYIVEDTGEKIEGRKIDIYMPSTREAKRFGRRSVEVEVIQYGAKTADL